MATTNSITTTYVGKDTKEFISPILNAGVTLGAGGVTIKKNVKYKARVTKVALSGLIADATCDFTPAGTVTQTEVWLTVKQLEVNMELCKADYFDDFVAENESPKDMPKAFLKYLLGEIGAHIADDIETKIWQGADGAGSFDGFETLFAADSNVAKISTPVAITASNAISEARRVIAAAVAAKPALLQKSDTHLYVGSTVFQALREAYNDKYSAKPQGEIVYEVDGVKIFYAAGMDAGSMVLAEKANLWFGTWESSELNRVSVLDMAAIDLSQNIRLAVGFFAGVQYGIAQEIFYYAGV